MKNILRLQNKESIMDLFKNKVDEIIELEAENAELKAQIEKMKCCFNCKHSRTEYEHCRTDKHEKWELKEEE